MTEKPTKKKTNYHNTWKCITTHNGLTSKYTHKYKTS